MDSIMDKQDKNQTESQNQTDENGASQQSSNLNITAKPFHPSLQQTQSEEKKNHSNEKLKLKIPMDGEIWKCISARTPPSCAVIPKTSDKSSFLDRLPIHIDRPLIEKSSFRRPKFHCSLSLNVSSDALFHVSRMDNIHIQMSLDGAIHVTCPIQNVQISVSNSGNSAALLHPNGRILQNHSLADVIIFDELNNFRRMAKIWYKGISFTAENIPLVYLVDEAGLRTNNDRFVDIKKSHVYEVFSKKQISGPYWFEEAFDAMQKTIHSQQVDGTEILEVNRIRITSSSDGALYIQRPNNKCMIRINPRKAGVSLTTSHMHCSASVGVSAHLFLRQGDRRIHFDGDVFCVRNNGHSAGLDERNRVTIFNKNSCSPNFK